MALPPTEAWELNSVVVPGLVLVFLAINMRNEEKYTGLHSALSVLLRPREILPELVGVLTIALLVASVLLLRSDGLLASPAVLDTLRASDEYLFGLRQVWPTLLNPDSLLVVQQLLHGLGIALLLAQGACSQAKGSEALAFGLLLLCMASGLRLLQWAEYKDYVPEGPLGGVFAALSAAAVFLTVCAAAWKAVATARKAGASAWRGATHVVALLALCAWLADANHLTASKSSQANILFAFIDVVELCAAPFLAVAVCTMAFEVPRLGGAVAVLAGAQVLGLWWFLDFLGLFENAASEDAFERITLEAKTMVRGLTYGHPFVVMSASHAVQSLAAAAVAVGYTVLRGAISDSPPSLVKQPSQGRLLNIGERNALQV